MPSSAEEVEQQITIPLERALNGIPSLDMMRSKNGPRRLFARRFLST